ncbi:Hypothetical predicted protein [Mytilus galloprovincialis]|uniref:CUB domain-containing protein n=2 Tax=Mytilus galloprovincialis TaxID=29158 RepID=A0A8B6HQN5_MYTGA|nr:Hypothetical predicted protein [Mytilus galloprovincialis]
MSIDRTFFFCLSKISMICGVYIRFFVLLLCSTCTMGEIETHVTTKPEVMSVISHIGPTMCTNKCKSLSGCNGVNFDGHHLTCELLRIHPTTDERSSKNGSRIAVLYSLQPINDPCWPNPCSKNNKCVVSIQNKPFCITTIETFMETIHSTNYPAEYPNYDFKSWSFTVEINFQLVLKFTAFNLETNCDFLKIYDKQGGTELYSLTGNYLPDDVWSTDSTFFIQFTTDHSYTFTGFSIDVYKTT